MWEGAAQKGLSRLHFPDFNSIRTVKLTIENQVSDFALGFGKNHGRGQMSVEILKPFLEVLFSSNRILKANSNLLLEIARELHSKLGDIDVTIQVI